MTFFDKEGKVKPRSREDIEGIHGETAWILISDAQTKMLYGDCCTSKASSLKYLESFLKAHSPPISDKFVVLDQGGELYQSLKVHNLFHKYDYDVYCTGAYASFQNGSVKRAHETIAISFGFYFLVLVYQSSFGCMCFDMLSTSVMHYLIVIRKNLQLN